MTTQKQQLGENRGGGLSIEVKDWKPNPEQVRAEMENLDAMFSAWPECRLCGQRTAQLDRYGLCSKTSQPHKDWRAGVRADMKAGA